jgi:hypothetical protein
VDGQEGVELGTDCLTLLTLPHEGPDLGLLLALSDEVSKFGVFLDDGREQGGGDLYEQPAVPLDYFGLVADVGGVLFGQLKYFGVRRPDLDLVIDGAGNDNHNGAHDIFLIKIS